MSRFLSTVLVPTVAAFGLLTVAGAGRSWGQAGSAGSPGRHYVKVEVKGELKRGQAPSSAPLLLANGLEFELHPGRGSTSPRQLEGMYGKTVVATGELEKRRDPEGREHMVFVVEGRLKVVDDSRPAAKKQYLVGYKKGHDEACRKLCDELGLKVLEHYKPGNYLRIEPEARTSPDFLSKLQGSEAVRYVEPQQTYTIPPGEDRPFIPRRP